MRQALVLLDGEHHPPVLRTALEALRTSGTEPIAVVMVGGGEKVAIPGVAPDLGVPTTWPVHPERELRAILLATNADVVVDLSGEPVVGPRRRLGLAALVLATGVAYEAPGLRYDPPAMPRSSTRPTIAVVATGKRTGKTAMAGAIARHAMGRGREPVIVAMGRGGPTEPVVVTEPPGLDALIAIAEAGGHAASDFYEDAITTGAPTVGCHRVGDGPSGAVAFSNLAEGVAAANRIEADLLILEGSGAALPPCHADALALVVPARLGLEELAATLPLSLLLADIIIVTLADTVPEEQVQALVAGLRRTVSLLRDDEIPVVRTAFRPHPLGDIRGRRVLLATTAPPAAGPVLVADLQTRHGAEVVAVTHHLADRPRLLADLEEAPGHDVVVTEVKAAGIDVAAHSARDRGLDVVLLDHRPVMLDGAGPSLDAVFDRLLDAAGRQAQTAV